MRRWPVIAAALFVATSAAWSLSEPQERALRRAIAESERGMSALTKGNLGKAREAFGASMKAVPDFPQAHLGLGHLAMRERRFEDALREFRDAESAYRSMSSAIVELETERYAKSRDELQQLRMNLAQLEAAASRAATAGEMGTSASQEAAINRERNIVEQRIQSLETMNPPTTLNVHEAPAEVLFFQGNALFDLKRTDEAIAAWETALKRDPKQPLAENNLAVAYWMSGRLQEAQAAMTRSETLGFKVNPSFRADLEKALSSTH
ncbi:MAG TPA: tetratricopeptide repeat protein [Candidatus Polarisedimenticolaceae bacterium]|nr:tetratricopeptide repeat protein [Candidatus Polarisedimenticolaceae bacterium]